MDWTIVAAVAAGLSLWVAGQPRRSPGGRAGTWPGRRMARTAGSRGSAHPNRAGPPAGWALGGARWWGRDEVPRRRRVVVGVGAGALGVLLLPGVGGWVLAGVLSVAAAAAVGHVGVSSTRTRELQLTAELPVALDLLSAMVVSGAPLRRAAAEVATVSPPTTAEVLELVVAHTEVGLTDEQAWHVLVERRHWSLGWAPVARDLARGAASGSGIDVALRTHAADARRARQHQLELTARTVGVRSVLPLLVCFLPAFLLVGVVPIIAGTVLRALS